MASGGFWWLLVVSGGLWWLLVASGGLLWHFSPSRLRCTKRNVILPAFWPLAASGGTFYPLGYAARKEMSFHLHFEVLKLLPPGQELGLRLAAQARPSRLFDAGS